MKNEIIEIMEIPKLLCVPYRRDICGISMIQIDNSFPTWQMYTKVQLDRLHNKDVLHRKWIAQLR
jgi:hypothetical protein